MSLAQHVSDAFAECNESRQLLAEWRDAKEAFLAADHANPKDFKARKPLFDRLANAEGALFKYAQDKIFRKEPANDQK